MMALRKDDPAGRRVLCRTRVSAAAIGDAVGAAAAVLLCPERRAARAGKLGSGKLWHLASEVSLGALLAQISRRRS